MPLTPADVANKQFKITFRGYSLDEVDAFLDEVEGELGRLLRENTEIKGSRAAAPYAEPPAACRRTGTAARCATGAPLAPGEGQEAALRTLLLAQRTADEVVAEARAEAARIVADAQGRADNVDHEIAARISAAMGGLEQRKRDLEVQINDLRAFEREYRTRLKAYLEGQLRDLARARRTRRRWRGRARGRPDRRGRTRSRRRRRARAGCCPAAGSAVERTADATVVPSGGATAQPTRTDVSPGRLRRRAPPGPRGPGRGPRRPPPARRSAAAALGRSRADRPVHDRAARDVQRAAGRRP